MRITTIYGNMNLMPASGPTWNVLAMFPASAQAIALLSMITTCRDFILTLISLNSL